MSSTRNYLRQKFSRMREIVHDARNMRQFKEQLAFANARLDKLEARAPGLIEMETVDQRRDADLFVPTEALFRESSPKVLAAAESSLVPASARQLQHLEESEWEFKPLDDQSRPVSAVASPALEYDSAPQSPANRPSAVSMMPLTPVARKPVASTCPVSGPSLMGSTLASE